MLIRPDGPSLIVHAPAKLNLFLEVLGRRTDGFHELESLMVTVSLYDTLSFTEEPTAAIRLRCFGVGNLAEVPTDGNNLVVQAARLLQERTGTSRGVSVGLWKRVPVAAGLAGGSTDAAATLLALNRLWKLELSSAELLSLAAELGSDVAFLASETPAAICRGRGEEVDPVGRPLGLSAVIARPQSGLSAAEVFQHCRVVETPRGARSLVDRLVGGQLAAASQLLHNSLQPTAETLNPEVTRLLNILAQQPVLGPLMTGSGTACFGLCTTHRLARRIAARLRAQGVDQVHAVQLGV